MVIKWYLYTIRQILIRFKNITNGIVKFKKSYLVSYTNSGKQYKEYSIFFRITKDTWIEHA